VMHVPAAKLPAARKRIKDQAGATRNKQTSGRTIAATCTGPTPPRLQARIHTPTPACAGTHGRHFVHPRNNRHFCQLAKPTSASGQPQ
jgi:hypothetical protein